MPGMSYRLLCFRRLKKCGLRMTPGLDFYPIAKQESLEEFIEEGNSGGGSGKIIVGHSLLGTVP